MTLRKYDTIFKTVRTMLNVGEFLAADELELMALEELGITRNYEVKLQLKRFYRGEINTKTLLAELEILKYESYEEFLQAYNDYIERGGRN